MSKEAEAHQLQPRSWLAFGSAHPVGGQTTWEEAKGLQSHYWTARRINLLDFLFGEEVNFLLKSIWACKQTMDAISSSYVHPNPYPQVPFATSAHLSAPQYVQNRTHILAEQHQSLNQPGLRSQGHSSTAVRVLPWVRVVMAHPSANQSLQPRRPRSDIHHCMATWPHTAHLDMLSSFLCKTGLATFFGLDCNTK